MHRWSELFIPTLREAPSDAEVASHKFLIRAGYIRQLAAGIYSYLFLGQRALLKITNVVREEMNKIGQEFYLPVLHPREIWEQSGRWSVMGDNMSHEFMVFTDAGEDMVAQCAKCGYAANLEKATSRLEHVEELPASGDGKPELVHTPGLKTIEDVAKFLGVSPKQKMKTLAYMAADTDAKTGKTNHMPVIAFLRGDHMLNEMKLSSAIGGKDFRPMVAEEIEQVFACPAGSLGPINLPQANDKATEPMVLVDSALKGRKNLIAGANKEDYHLKNVTPERDFPVSNWVDLRTVSEGEGCPKCGWPLKVAKAVEMGHIFKLGYKYSESMGVRVLDKDGKEVTRIMGSCGSGIEWLLTTVHAP